MMPSTLRSSGQKPKRSAIAARGDERLTGLPPISAVPLSALCTPNSNSAVSVRPEPNRPAIPTTSPLRTSRSNGLIVPVLP